MIGNISKGRGFRGTLNYLLGKEERQLIGGNMAGETARELAAEFKLSYQLNPTVERPVFHVSLSLPERENYHERLDNERWNAVAEDYLQQMGFTDNQYVVVRHQDTDHDHVHIVAARGRLDGTCVNDWLDHYRSQEVIRSLEQQYHLEAVQSSWERQERNQSRGQYQRYQREMKEQQDNEAERDPSTPPTLSVHQQLQTKIDLALQDSRDLRDLKQRLKREGVTIRTRTQRNGEINGISYELDGVAVPGNKLGPAYAWNGIASRLPEPEKQRLQETQLETQRDRTIKPKTKHRGIER